MLVRIWHGKTRRDRGDAYADFVAARAVPDYRSTPGNLGVYVLRRDEADETHFLTVTFWESEDAVRGFAGDDVLKAKYYPEDDDFLLEFEPEAVHYTVVANADENDQLREEYDFSQMAGGVRGKHAAAYRRGTNLVRLDPDVAEAFTTDESVNEALRAVLKAAAAIPASRAR